MDKKQHMVPLKELNLTNRFLFDQVMEDREIKVNKVREKR